MTDLDVLYLTKYDRKGASSRYRSLQYFPHLEARGIRCHYEPLFSDRYLDRLYETGSIPLRQAVGGYLRRIRSMMGVGSSDVVVVEKELLPYVPPAFERLLTRTDTPVVVDYDDAIFHTYDRSANPLVRRLLGNKIDTVMRCADAIVVGNEYLAARARKAGASRIEIIPTVIDLDRYPHVPPEAEGAFTIGWIGSPSTARYVEAIAPALRTVCGERDAHVLLVGSGEVDLPGVPHEVREWSEETEVEDVASFDVGIMPLEDTPWERGKCGLKLLQYMGCAKPVVTSPVGVNAEIVEDGRHGLYARSPEEWIESLVALGEDRQRARRMGEAGRERVAERYCLDVTAPELAGVLASVGGGDGTGGA